MYYNIYIKDKMPNEGGELAWMKGAGLKGGTLGRGWGRRGGGGTQNPYIYNTGRI